MFQDRRLQKIDKPAGHCQSLKHAAVYRSFNQSPLAQAHTFARKPRTPIHKGSMLAAAQERWLHLSQRTIDFCKKVDPCTYHLADTLKKYDQALSKLYCLADNADNCIDEGSTLAFKSLSPVFNTRLLSSFKQVCTIDEVH